VLRTLGEPEDGVYDWNLLNGGKGWEASNHTPGSVVATPHREHRRERERERDPNRRRQPADGTTPNQLVLSPTPAHVKGTRRVASGDRPRDLGSVQPLPPNSRRVSQHKELASAGLSAPHPYATAPSPTGYRNSPTPNTFGRHSPSNVLSPNGNGLNGSQSALYAQAHAGKNDSPENMTLPGGILRDGVKGMGVYDREQMRRADDQDEVHGRRKGFWSALCCRA